MQRFTWSYFLYPPLIRIPQRILVLTGPAGAAKTTTLRVLSKEMGFDILEWQNSIDDTFMDDGMGE